MKMKNHKKFNIKIVGIMLLLTVLLGLCSCADSKEEVIYSDENLAGKRILTIEGSIYDRLIETDERFSGCTLNYVITSVDAQYELLDKKADAFITDYYTAIPLVQNNDGLSVIDNVYDISDYAIAFSKDSELLEKFNAVIQKFKQDGTLESLEEKWLNPDNYGKDKTIPEQTWNAENGTLLCFDCIWQEPLCYAGDDGTEIGYEVELVLRIAEQLGYRIEFNFVDFTMLVSSVEAGMADLAIGAISAMEERMEEVSFSDTYLDARSAVVVRTETKEKVNILEYLGKACYRTFVEENNWKLLLRGIFVTIEISALSIIFGLSLGFSIFFLDFSENKIQKKISGFLSNFFLYIPPLVWLMLAYYVLFKGSGASNIFVGIVAFSVMYSVQIKEELSLAYAQVDSGQKEAAISMGYTPYQALFKLYIPQLMPYFAKGLTNSILSQIRNTSLAGMISIMDLQTVADVVRAKTYNVFVPIVFSAIMYIFLARVTGLIIQKLIMTIFTEKRTEEEIRKRIARGKLG